MIFAVWVPGQAPKRRQGPGTGPAHRRFGARAPECENNVKIQGIKCKHIVICHFHTVFILISHLIRTLFRFSSSGPKPGPNLHILFYNICHKMFDFVFIFISYDFRSLGSGPGPKAASRAWHRPSPLSLWGPGPRVRKQYENTVK